MPGSELRKLSTMKRQDIWLAHGPQVRRGHLCPDKSRATENVNVSQIVLGTSSYCGCDDICQAGNSAGPGRGMNYFIPTLLEPVGQTLATLTSQSSLGTKAAHKQQARLPCNRVLHLWIAHLAQRDAMRPCRLAWLGKTLTCDSKSTARPIANAGKTNRNALTAM